MSGVDALLQTPPAQLVADLTSLRDERALIEDKEAVLIQILDLLLKQGGQIAEEVAALGGASGFGSLREQIRQVLISMKDEEPLQVPKEVQKELVSRGNRTATLENVRVTMKRMADDGELVRPSEDAVAYGLPDTPKELLAMWRDMASNQSQPK
jgi:hypothetical protein